MMSTADQIIQLLTDKASQQLSTCSPTTVVHLLAILKSILTRNSYNHEYKTTLDGCEEDPDDFYQDSDYEEEDTKTKVFENFTLSYIKRALEFELNAQVKLKIDNL